MEGYQMKLLRYITALILTLATMFMLILTQNTAQRVSTLDKEVINLNDKTKHLNDEGEIERLERQITALEAQVQEYTEKVDNMTMDYMTLDEILKQMFGEAQAAYFKEGRGK